MKVLPTRLRGAIAHLMIRAAVRIAPTAIICAIFYQDKPPALFDTTPLAREKVIAMVQAMMLAAAKDAPEQTPESRQRTRAQLEWFLGELTTLLLQDVTWRRTEDAKVVKLERRTDA